MNRTMAKIQELLPLEAEVRLVSFSVDPETDTPDVLKSYARRYSQEGKPWNFLTGSRPTIERLARESFRLGVGPKQEDGGVEPITHSNRMVLVDRQLRIRGYYTGTEEASIPQLLKDVARLVEQS
jgi:protein SCO1/2